MRHWRKPQQHFTADFPSTLNLCLYFFLLPFCNYFIFFLCSVYFFIGSNFLRYVNYVSVCVNKKKWNMTSFWIEIVYQFYALGSHLSFVFDAPSAPSSEAFLMSDLGTEWDVGGARLEHLDLFFVSQLFHNFLDFPRKSSGILMR